MQKRIVSLAVATAFLLPLTACVGSPDTGGAGFVQPAKKKRSRDGGRGTAFVSPAVRDRVYRKVAVMPFQAPVELAGASMADVFATELLKTYKYQLVERSQMEKILGEQALRLKGVTDSVLAMEVGRILGVQGVIVGTVPEYGYQAVGSKKLPAIGMNVRMIDVEDGTVAWSVSSSGTSAEVTSLSGFAERLIQLAVERLQAEWVRAGDTTAVNLPAPQVVDVAGSLRSATLEVLPDPSGVFGAYVLERSRSREGPFKETARRKDKGRGETFRFEDRGLLDAETYYYRVAGLSSKGLTGSPAGPFAVTTAGPPAPVEDFTAASDLIRESALSWRPLPDDTLRGYRIHRRGPRSGWKKIREINNPAASSYVDGKLRDGETYRYRIEAVNRVGVAGPPVEAEATTKGPPAPVEGLAAEDGLPRRVTVTWFPALEEEVAAYHVYRARREGGDFEKVARVAGRDTESWEDGGSSGWFGGGSALEDGERYFYRVRAVNVVGVESPDSATATAVTKPVPAAVAGLDARGGARAVDLRWSANGEPDIARYEVFRSEKEGDEGKRIAETDGGDISFRDVGLPDARRFVYRVRAVDADGLVGAYSPPVSARTKPRPASPRGGAARFEAGEVTLTWLPGSEPDVVRYIVTRGGFLSGDVLGETPAPPFVFTPEKSGEFKVRVRAVDADGLESKDSNEIIVRVP